MMKTQLVSQSFFSIRLKRLAVLAALGFCQLLTATTFHVAPGGSEGNPGTQAQPLATLAAARDAARAAGGTGHVILLAPGQYYHPATVNFDERDNGLTIRGAEPGATAELYGGMPVTGWERWKGNIWRAPVPVGQRFYNLIVDGRSATMAQTPNAGSGYGGGAYSVGEPETWKPREKVFVPEDWRAYDYSDAQVFAFHDSVWFSEMHAILAPPDEEGNLLVTLGNMGTRLFIRGVLEFLDEPGEWCLKNQQGYVYYWPKSGTPLDKRIIRPHAEKFLSIHGSSPATPAQNISIENVSIIGSDFCEVWSLIQDNTAIEAQQRGMVFGENVVGLAVRDCRLLAAGHSAVWLNRAAQNCVVENNLITEAGFTGVYMNGWELGQGPFASVAESYVNKGHRVEGNFIYDCGKFIGAGSGIQFYQSGDNLIARNEIGQMPRYGISYKGMRSAYIPSPQYGQTINWNNHWDTLHTRNNIIRGNEIYSVCRNSHDFGAIESWGVGRDNVWENNAVHDTDSAIEWNGYSNILYADDHSHYLTMRNNILYHCNGGAVTTAFQMKSLGQVTSNNLLVDCSLGIIASLTPFLEPAGDYTINHNVFAIRPNTARYSVNSASFNAGITEVNYNAVIPKNPADPNPAPYPAYSMDLNSYFGDPQLQRAKDPWDIQYGDYSLAPGSPAYGLGYTAIPTAEIGLRPDFQFDKTAATRRHAADKIQAEDYQRMMNLRTDGGLGLRNISAGAWAKYSNIDFGNGQAEKAVFKLSSTATSGTLVEMRIGSPGGQLIAQLAAGQSSCPLASVSGVHNVYLVFPTTAVTAIDWFMAMLPSDAATSTVAAKPALVANDGVSTATVTVTLRDERGNFVPHKTVELASSRGAMDTITAVSGISNAAGEAVFTVKSGTPGEANLTASVPVDSMVIAQTAAVTFSPLATSSALSSVSVAPASLRADGISAATVTVTLRDGSNNPVAGKTVVLEKIPGAGAPVVTPLEAVTDASGVATFVVKSTAPGTYVFTAASTTDSMEVAQTATLHFTPMAEAQPVYSTRGDGRIIATFTSGSGTWTVPPGVTSVEVLAIGGGGGGGAQGGGGGAGGLLYYGPETPANGHAEGSHYEVVPGTGMTVTIGSGGSGGVLSNGSPDGARGADSVFGALVAHGGGSGLAGGNYTGAGGGTGGAGGNGAPGQGFPGGGSNPPGVLGSGGGAGGPGMVNQESPGGVGLNYAITGSTAWYAGGGGGAANAPGGLGGGGHGSLELRTPGFDGTPETGGGGGGGWVAAGGAGGSGIVIVAYDGSGKTPTALQLAFSPDPATLGESVTVTAAVTADGGTANSATGTCTFQVDGVLVASVPVSNGIAAFTTSSLALGERLIRANYSGDDQFHPSAQLETLMVNHPQKAVVSFSAVGEHSWTVPAGVTSVEVLVVGGGGGGGRDTGAWTASGGGAGGLYATNQYAVTPGDTVAVAVGAGGAASTTTTAGASGGNSTFGPIIAYGGGGGGTGNPSHGGHQGGSSPNGGIDVIAGFAGGGPSSNNGGGGAGQAGKTEGYGDNAWGGRGVQNAITGTATWYAGGGGGVYTGATVPVYGTTTGAAGGLGGGGNGGGPTHRQKGVDGLGGGGGAGMAGGSGVVIIAYARVSPVPPYTAWAAGYPGVDLTDPAADFDGDGLSNQAEFAFGLIPNDGSSNHPIKEIALLESDSQFRYTRWADSGLSYTVWTSPDLETWTEDTSASQIAADPVGGVETVTVTVTTPPTDGRLFVRVRAAEGDPGVSSF